MRTIRNLATLGRLVLSLWVSSVVLILASAAQGHEVRPAIADLTISGEEITLEIQVSLEPLIAGVDLEGLQDTNESPKAKEVDRLRALEPDQLEAAFREAWPGIRDGLTLQSGDQNAEVRLSGVDIGETGNVALPRDSRLLLDATLPGAGPVTVGWPSEFGPLVVRQMGAGEDGYTGYLTGGQLSDPIPRSGVSLQSTLSVFTTYVGLGFEHIIPKGLDHILFVLGLFFFSLQMRPLLFQVTAFTLAHTATLALAVLGYVSVPAAVVEPLIAASIVYVAVENIVHPRLTPWRTAIVFGFGLLHGLGFASVLGEIGLSPARLITGLIGFNVGVELGQLAVIGAAFLLVGIWFGRRSWYRKAIAVPCSVAIAAIGAYWSIERVFF